MTAFRYTAGLRGTAGGELDDEEVERREAHKKLRRRPLSETLEQLGEGRGMHLKASSVIFSWLISSRYLRSWLGGEEATEDYGEVRNRRKGSGGLDATRNFFEVHYRSRHRVSRLGISHTCTYHLFLQARRMSDT